jgi:hypothetical protein
MKINMKKYNKQIKNYYINRKGHSILTNFTLIKFIAGLITTITIAGIKYMISGNLTFNLGDFQNNVGMGLSG